MLQDSVVSRCGRANLERMQFLLQTARSRVGDVFGGTDFYHNHANSTDYYFRSFIFQ